MAQQGWVCKAGWLTLPGCLGDGEVAAQLWPRHTSHCLPEQEFPALRWCLPCPPPGTSTALHTWAEAAWGRAWSYR